MSDTTRTPATTVLNVPFEPTARLSLERYGAISRGDRRLDLEVGGYLAFYVGRPGDGNLDVRELTEAGADTMHESQAIGGATRYRDRTELLNLAVHAVAALSFLGILNEALDHLPEARAAGIGEQL